MSREIVPEELYEFFSHHLKSLTKDTLLIPKVLYFRKVYSLNVDEEMVLGNIQFLIPYRTLKRSQPPANQNSQS